MNSKSVKIISIIVILILTVLIAFSIRDVEREVRTGGSDVLLTKTTNAGESYEKKILNDKEKEELFKSLDERNIIDGIASIKDYSNSIFSDSEMLNLLLILDENSFEKTEDGKLKLKVEDMKVLSKKYFNREINLDKAEVAPEEDYILISKKELKDINFTYETIQNISSSDYELIVHDDNNQKYSLCFSLRDKEIVYISFEKI
jgi:hypothetical protein